MKKKVIVGVLGSLVLLGGAIAGVVLYRNKKAREEFMSTDLDDLFDDSEFIFSSGGSFCSEFGDDLDLGCLDNEDDLSDDNEFEDTLDTEDDLNDSEDEDFYEGDLEDFLLGEESLLDD